MDKIDWIGLDWGTTHFRAWAIGADGEILDHVKSAQGMGGLSPDEFEPILISNISHWLDDAKKSIPAIACGMVGAKQGWAEAAYVQVPSKLPLAEQLVKAPTNDPRIDVFIVPGMSQLQPADVMRGEETQIAGFLASMPTFSGVVCLPGTHAKWVIVENGEIKSFTTFMTGEIFGLLAKQSVLRHSVGTNGWDEDAFLDAVDVAIQNPENVAQELFSIRPQSMLHGTTAETSKARLSGLLIGAELKATQALWSQNQVCIVGDADLAKLYNTALQIYDCHPTVADGDMMTLGGLHAVAQTLKQKKTDHE